LVEQLQYLEEGLISPTIQPVFDHRPIIELHKGVPVKKLATVVAILLLVSCGQEKTPPETAVSGTANETTKEAFQVQVDRFADVKILRYTVPGFEELSLREKKLAYYLSQAALSGHDIIYDQNYKYNLRIRKLLSAIVSSYSGDRDGEDFVKLHDYAKRVWFANGIHHNYSSDKMLPEFTPEELGEMVRRSDPARLPLDEGQSIDELLALLQGPVFDPKVAAKKVNLSPDIDQLTGSATNYYDGVTADEAAAFYAEKTDPDPARPVSWGLNSQLAKVDGEIVERTWKIGGMYSPAIEQVVFWLKKASSVAENDLQKSWIDKLVKYYYSGDLGDYDDYNIAWVADSDSRIDTVNGFTEVYGDPLGYRGSWEAVVSIRDLVATHRIATIGDSVQWFEDHSPIMDEHKKKKVVGISAKVITVVMEGGDSAPATPIGINLPNANWIRKEHGSKSVTLGNIMEAYELSSAASGLNDEFAYTDEQKARNKEHGGLASLLHTDLHEVIGHASGQINSGVGTPKETLQSYASTLEEARADLVSHYFIMDPKLVELGVMPSLEVGRAEYDVTIRNGLMSQLLRLKPGDDIEEAHMRNRQLIAGWVYEQGLQDNVIEKIVENSKTYYVIRDYDALRVLFGELLREIQRIKSEGDFEAGKALVETYGVKVDPAIHAEVLARVEPLNIAPYSGFIQPRLVPVEDRGEITDVLIEYPDSFTDQMLGFEDNYSFLPLTN
jgi:dipeptidyl-peptidase III